MNDRPARAAPAAIPLPGLRRRLRLRAVRWRAVGVLALAGVLLALPAVLPGVAAEQATDALAGVQGAAAAPWPWWGLALVLFGLTSVLGVLAAMAGIGGGVLFVPIVSGLMPFVHIDFVRGAGIMVALTGALSAGPRLIGESLADLRLSIPVALAASTGSYFGAVFGLHIPATVVQLTLGVVILIMAILMAVINPREPEIVGRGDWLAAWLRIGGVLREPGREPRPWRPRALVVGLLMFGCTGFMAGLFGLGGAWANVPVLNLVMALPLRLSVATSYFVLAIAGPTAALVYATNGAMLPLVVVPSVLGIMLGARIGTWLLVRVHTPVLRKIVIGVLVVAAVRALLRGMGI